MDRGFEEKKMALCEQLAEYAKEDTAVAFSGGVDSALLLKLLCDAAKKSGTRVYAVTAHTRLHPQSDLETAGKVAEESGAVHEVVIIDELADAGILNNPTDRCYRCKKTIFCKIRECAAVHGVTQILEGTNEDDLHQYRPGIRAIRELGIASPLAENGFTKKEIREFAEELGISVANRPQTPCLATRIPYGESLNYELLSRIEEGEKYLRELGFYNIRLRVHGDIARIEVDQSDILKLAEQREKIVKKMKASGFRYVTIDLEGFRSGSMDTDKIENGLE